MNVLVCSHSKFKQTGKENPFHNDSKWSYRKTYLEYWELCPIILSNIQKKRKGLLGIYFFLELSSFSFPCRLFNFDSRYSDTDKSEWFNKWINSEQPTIHPMTWNWILNIVLCTCIQYAWNGPGLGLLDQQKTKHFSKWNSAKLCFLFFTFGDH